MNEIGKNLKRVRLLNNISLHEAGKLLNMSAPAVSKYEKGEILPNSQKLIEFANAYKVRTIEFLKSYQVPQMKFTSFRKKQRLKGKNLELLQETIQEEVAKYLEVIEMNKLENKSKIKKYKCDSLEEAEEAANAAAQLAAAKTYAIERLDDYSEAKAKADATEAEKTAYDKAVADGKDAINAAEDQEAVAEAFTQAKAAVDAALAKIDKDRADAAAAAQEMAEADQAVADAKTVAETAKTTADEAAADEYASGADKTAIANVKAAVEAKINAAKNLPETATAEAKNAAAKDIEDAVKALNAAVDTAVVNSAAAKAKAEEEATAAAQLAAAKNNAKERLEDVHDAKNQTDYRAAQQKELADAREAGYQAIEEAATPAEALEALMAAKEALNAVKTDSVLTKEEKEEADSKAALAFTTQISELPAAENVKLADKAAIEAAGKAYDALSADQKLKVDAATKKKLESAQAALKKLEDALANAQKTASAAMSKPVKVKAKTKGIKISWTTCKEADGYEVYVQYAGKKFKKVTRNIKKSTTGKTKVFKINGKKLNRKKDICVYVSAYKMIDGKKVILANSKVATLKAKRNSK